jgi:hypothetical protein
MSREEYIRWPTTADIPLVLSLVDPSGSGSVGKHPEVSIRRYQETHGAPLDNYYWNGSSFVPGPYWHPLAEIDPANSPGMYSYLFEQTKVGLEIIYVIYYRHESSPVGFAAETHVITNEVYIPHAQPDPILIGSDTIMGQLELVKGLLHHNSMLDRQVYEGSLLRSARLRMFDHPSRVPSSPDGNETLGRLAEFEIKADYESGVNKSFVLKRIYP